MLRDLYISLELGFPSTCFLWRIRVPKEKKKKEKENKTKRGKSVLHLFWMVQRQPVRAQGSSIPTSARGSHTEPLLPGRGSHTRGAPARVQAELS